MKSKTAYITVALAATLLAASSLWPQDPSANRPRIGLVLSGGGALGSAHVGVLKVLEELRIPVDYVAGTSMGAIVGGLYSAGVSPAEMEEIVVEIDWRDMFDDRPPRRELPYRRKVDDQTNLARLEMGFNRGSFQLPPGLISGQKLGFTLQALAVQTAGIDDFDDLPLPFRAVATDIETGEMVVLSRGDLGRAIRASMSIPGVFSPIEIDGRLLVDGGLVRNLPVDVVREMGAEVVIAVDVGAPLLEKAELASLAKVTNQMIGMQIRKNVQEQVPRVDVLIKPELEGFGSGQFARALEMVPLGEEAARGVAAELSKLAVSEERFAAHRERIHRRKKSLPPKVSSVQLTLASTADPQLVFSRITTRAGDPFDLEVVRRDLERLYKSGDYERVDFSLAEADDGTIVFIDAYDKSWGPNYFRFGLNLFADLEGESSFDVLTTYTMTKLNRRRGEFKAQAQLGENPQLSGEYYQPLSLRQTWFLSAQLQQGTASVFSPVGEGLFAPYRVDLLLGILDLGLQLGKYAELRLGLLRSRTHSELRSGTDSVAPSNLPAEVDFDLGGYRFAAVVDQFDNMNFPRHGYFVATEYLATRESLGSDAEYERLFTFMGAAATHKRHTILGLSTLYSALGSESPEIYDVGGLFALSGYRTDSIHGRYGGYASLVYLYRLFQMPPTIGDGLYVGGSIEAGNLWNEASQVDLGDLRYSVSLVIGVDTVFGPLYLAQGFSDDGDNPLYLFVGRNF